LQHAQLSGDLSIWNRALLKNTLCGCGITVDLLFANVRKLSAACSEGCATRAHTEHFTEPAILGCDGLLELFLGRHPHGRSGEEQRVQPKGCQYGKE
jgi:hypothetical protein